VLGAENVKILDILDINLIENDQFSNVLNDILRFVGLCKFDNFSLESFIDGNDLVSNMMEDVVDFIRGDFYGLKMSKDVYLKLDLFFLPFNTVLMNFTYSKLNYSLNWDINNGIIQSHMLEPYSEGFNHSRPLLWFETMDKRQVVSRGKLVPRLIPKRFFLMKNAI
jgi:predicted nucleotidyltransferase